MELTYKQIEELLAALHGVHPDRRVALLGRIKHFQRLGWPEGTNVGKGSRVRYDTRRTFSLVVAFELLEIGMMPDRIVELLGSSHMFFPIGLLAAVRHCRGMPGEVALPGIVMDGREVTGHLAEGGDSLLVAYPSALQSLRMAEQKERATITTVEGLAQLGIGRRAAVFNLSVLVKDVLGVAGDIDLDVIEQELEQWIDGLRVPIEVSLDSD